MTRERILASSIGLATLVAALSLSALSTDEPDARKAAEAKRVKVGAVERSHLASTLRFAGVTRSARRASLSFSVGGRLASRPAEIGSRVAAGQVLARINDRELTNAADSAAAALSEIEARAAQVARDRDRVEKLVASKAATAEELEQVSASLAAVRAGHEVAAARLREARRLLDEAVLEAPWAGTVTAVFLEPGEHAAPGRPVVEVSGETDLEVEVGVPEGLAPRLARGGRVAVELPFAGAVASGVVSSLGRAAAGGGRLFPVVVALEAAPAEGPVLVPGMTAEVLFEVDTEALVTVPLAAVVNPGGHSPAVFRVAGGSVHRVDVEVDRLVAERVAVRGPLSPGERVVVSGHGGLIDGQPVEVVP